MERKNNIETLVFFDFDHTLYDTPLPTDENRKILLDTINYDRSGWWGREESLRSDIFDIKQNPFIKERYEHHTKMNHTKMLMTGRIGKIRNSVRNLTDRDNLKFDKYLYADGRKTVDFKLDNILKEVKSLSPKTVYFYDDRTAHIQSFRNLGDQMKDELDIDFKLFHVIGHNAYEVEYGKKLR